MLGLHPTQAATLPTSGRSHSLATSLGLGRRWPRCDEVSPRISSITAVSSSSSPQLKLKNVIVLKQRGQLEPQLHKKCISSIKKSSRASRTCSLLAVFVVYVDGLFLFLRYHGHLTPSHTAPAASAGVLNLLKLSTRLPRSLTPSWGSQIRAQPLWPRSRTPLQ